MVKNKSIKIQLLLAIFVSLITMSMGYSDGILKLWSTFLLLFLPCYISGWLILWQVKNGNKEITGYSYINPHQAIYPFAFSLSFITTASIVMEYDFLAVIAVGVGIAIGGVAGVSGAYSNAGIAVLGINNIVDTVGFFIFAGSGFALFYIFQIVSSKEKWAWGFWFIYNFVLFTIAYSTIWSSLNFNDTAFILFFILLPLINAPLDWVSLNITRGLLNNIRHEHHSGYYVFLWALFDLLLALIFLLMVSAVLVITVGIINLLSAEKSILDLHQILSEIIQPEKTKNYYWVYAILLTTLIPTLVHFTLAGASLIIWLPKKYRYSIVNNIEQNHYKLWLATLYLTVTPFIALLSPLALLYTLYYFLTLHGGWLSTKLWQWASLLAHWINPIV